MFDALGPLLLVAIWIIRQVYTAIQEQKEAEAAKEAAQRRELKADLAGEAEPAQAAAPAQAKAAPDDVRSEVEEFLKRVGQMGEQPAAPPAREAEEPPRRRGPIDPFEERPRRQKQRPAAQRATPRPPAQPEIELLVGVDEPVQPRPEKSRPTEPPRKERRELRHLPESQLAEQAATMGQRVAGADDRLEARLHQKFDHRLGKLSTDKAGVADDKPAEEPISGAKKIRAMLAAPGGVRDAVILSEILRRPGL